MFLVLDIVLCNSDLFLFLYVGEVGLKLLILLPTSQVFGNSNGPPLPVKTLIGFFSNNVSSFLQIKKLLHKYLFVFLSLLQFTSPPSSTRSIQASVSNLFCVCGKFCVCGQVKSNLGDRFGFFFFSSNTCFGEFITCLPLLPQCYITQRMVKI